MLDPAVLRARDYFPRGLSQPETGFRFSLDALLLAAFAGQAGKRVLDLGTGCGVVGLAWALNHPDSFVAGVDINPDMLAHARENARRLGLAGRFSAVRADVARPGGLTPESMELVLCNPPYRDPGAGRTCPHAGKNAARFESGAALADFVRATALFLRNKKSCVFIHLAERVDDLLVLLHAHRLRSKELLFVHPRTDALARLVLVRAVKNGGPGLTVAAPLVLHGENGLTPQALAFCPWLACNA